MTNTNQELKKDNLVSNSEALFLFDASLCNPNGDIDQENRPRMDYATSTALVSDVRRKRDCRDYLKDVKGKAVFVNKIDLSAQAVIINAMLNQLNKNNQNYEEAFGYYVDKKVIRDVLDDNEKQQYLDLFINDKSSKTKKKAKAQQTAAKSKTKKTTSKEIDLSKADPAVRAFIQQFAINHFIDNKLFGITLAISGIKKDVTGPIQIHWGHSLHPVTLVESNRITAAFASSEKSGQFSFGNRQQLYYGLFAHYLTISRTEAAKVNLTKDDVNLFRESLICGLSNNRTTSKLGQTPLLYLEIEYKPKSNLLLGDLTRFISVEYDNNANNGYGIRSYRDITKISYENLLLVLDDVKDEIDAIHLWRHPIMKIKSMEQWAFPIDELKRAINIEELKF